MLKESYEEMTQDIEKDPYEEEHMMVNSEDEEKVSEMEE